MVEKSGVEKSRAGKFMVEKSMVEKSGVEMSSQSPGLKHGVEKSWVEMSFNRFTTLLGSKFLPIKQSKLSNST